MSALGQKQTYAVQNGMSALPPKATSNATYGDVRLGPIADIALAKAGCRRLLSIVLCQRIFSCRAHRCAISKNNPGSERGAGPGYEPDIGEAMSFPHA